jgi:transposase InsO family protein
LAAEMPNECRQSDFTHYPLAGGTDTEILTWLDDHSRYALSVTAHRRETGADVLSAFRAACDRHGVPASTLADNGISQAQPCSGRSHQDASGGTFVGGNILLEFMDGRVIS